MMGGPGMFAMMLWMPIGILLCVVVLAAVIWLVIGILNRKKTLPMPYIPQRQDSYRTYEQGYQPPEPRPETYQEGGQQYHYPELKQEYDQPQVQYPQAQEMPPQH